MKRPTTYDRQMDTALISSGRQPININVSYKSSINDSNIAKDDIAQLELRDNYLPRNNKAVNRQPNLNNFTLDNNLSQYPNQYNYLNNRNQLSPESNYTMYVPNANTNNDNNNSYSNDNNQNNSVYYYPDNNQNKVNNFNNYNHQQNNQIQTEPVPTNFNDSSVCPIMINRPWSEFLSGDYKN